MQEWHIRNYCVRDATPQYDLKDYIVFSDFVQIGVLFPDTLEQQGLLLADLESGDFMLHKWVNIYSSMDELERDDD